MKKMTLCLFLLGIGLVFSQEAVIREINGTVEVKTADEVVWSPAHPGQNITRTTMLSTGFKSTAVVGLGNSVLTVQPLTRLTVEELEESGGDERINLNLRVGRIRADVKPPVGGNTAFTVRSPSATASVRGTVFEFNGTQLQVEEGRVHLSGTDQSGTYVGAGHQVQTDIVTGWTENVAETARAELSPPLPAGMNSGASREETAPLLRGDVDVGFDWQ
jgi:hypothetical protein